MRVNIDDLRPKVDNRSELVKAKERAVNGKVNACPFGCEFRHLDDHGYCRHLIGFSNDQRHFEPMVKDPVTGRRVVRVRNKPKEEVSEWDDDGKPVMMQVSEPILEPVLKGDVLVKISTSFRVYRDVSETGRTPRLKAEFHQPSQEETDAMIRQSIEQPERPIKTFTAPKDDFAVVE